MCYIWANWDKYSKFVSYNLLTNIPMSKLLIWLCEKISAKSFQSDIFTTLEHFRIPMNEWKRLNYNVGISVDSLQAPLKVNLSRTSCTIIASVIAHQWQYWNQDDEQLYSNNCHRPALSLDGVCVCVWRACAGRGRGRGRERELMKRVMEEKRTRVSSQSWKVFYLLHNGVQIGVYEAWRYMLSLLW